MKKNQSIFPNNKQDVSLSILDVQKAKIDKAHQQFLNSPTLENMQFYKDFIKEFILLVTTKMYMIGTKSNWEYTPQKDIFLKIIDIEHIFNDIYYFMRNAQESFDFDGLDNLKNNIDNKSKYEIIELEDIQLLSEKCDEINRLITDFLDGIYDGDR